MDDVQPDIDATLKQRGQRYGSFKGHARITQAIKNILTGRTVLEAESDFEREKRREKWDNLDHDKREALEMISHKIGRILNGDPQFHDSWHDITGYSKLVADTLQKEGDHG